MRYDNVSVGSVACEETASKLFLGDKVQDLTGRIPNNGRAVRARASLAAAKTELVNANDFLQTPLLNPNMAARTASPGVGD